MASASTPTSTATPTQLDALEIDTHTLALLLRRNRAQHRRCLYFHRLTMALRATTTPSLQDVGTQLARWRVLARSFVDKHGGERAGAGREVWARADRRRSAKDGDDLQEMSAILRDLKTLATRSLPEILSRILHATPSVLYEITRGYFVPFLTVALACLGRMHAVLLRLGRAVALTLQEVVPQLREIFSKKKWPACEEHTLGWRTLEHLVASPFFPETKKDGTWQASTERAASREWNALMTQFLDISHDDLTKRTTYLVRKQRWETSVARFGLKGCAKYPETLVRTPVRPSGSARAADREAADDDERHHDVGEPVDGTSPALDVAPRGTARDRARYATGHKKKEEGPTTMPTPRAKQASRKKRRKKKAGVQTVSEIGNANAPQPSNRAKQENCDKDNTNTRDKAPLQAASHLEESPRPEQDAHGIAASDEGQCDAGATAASKPQRREGGANVEHRKKEKKKSKKAKKQKRKSSSVIDDIFG